MLWEYDANGNAVRARVGTGDCAKRFDYGVHNVPARVTSGGVATDFVQDERGRRFYRLARAGDVTGPVLSQTFHVGETFFEEEWVEGVAAWRHYVHTPEGVVAIAKRHSSQPAWDWRFWHRDHLGSPVRETYWDGSGAEAASWDAWGKRRLPDAADGTPGNLVALTGPRGFTGHEHLDGHGLIHMNGRMYEPALGRFVNADPLVQAPLDARSWNRYSYVMNNPLAYTDPTGYSWWTKWRRPIFAIAAAWALGPGGFFGEGGIFGSGGLGWASGTTAGYTSAAASGFAAGGIQGGNLESAIQGAFSAALFYGAGSLTDGFAPGSAPKVAAHAAAGCASGAAAGGSCRSAALSAGFAELAGPLVQDLAGQNVSANVAGRAMVGGAASRLGGGSFENGAVTAAFGYLFNHCAHGNCTSELEQKLYDWFPGYKAGTLIYNQTLGDGGWTGWEMLDAASIGLGVAGRGLQALQVLRGGTVGIEFGANANQVSHAFRHIDAIGMSRDAVTTAIRADIPALQVGQGVTRTVTVNGVDLTYRAHRVNETLINVGRITPPRP